MLKTRVLPTLLYKDVGLVKGVGFDSRRRIGSAMEAVRVYNLREVDEIAFLDVSATPNARRPDFAIVDELADGCFVPLAAGGGVRSLDDVHGLLRVGADKVVIGTAAFEEPALLTEAANRFGAQCIVVSIDVRRGVDGAGAPEVFVRCGTLATGRDPVTFAREVASRGAGEILLTSVERDGTMSGYDLAVVAEVSAAVSIPVIASGGAGTYEHMRAAIQDAGASAVAAASLFHFTESTPLEAKRYLRDRGCRVRT